MLYFRINNYRSIGYFQVLILKKILKTKKMSKAEISHKITFKGSRCSSNWFFFKCEEEDSFQFLITPGDLKHLILTRID